MQEVNDFQLYLAIGVPIVANAATMLLGFTLLSKRTDDFRDDVHHRIDSLRSEVIHRFESLEKLFDSKLSRVEEVMDARLRHLEENR